MTMKHPVYKTELILDHAKREAYLEFSTSAGGVKIPVQVPEIANSTTRRTLCETLITLKYGAALAISYMKDREDLHGDSYWEQFFGTSHEEFSMNREMLLNDVQECIGD